MTDIFEHTILCNTCNKKMVPIELDKGGFKLRAVECKDCKNRIIHPSDLKEYEDFLTMKKKQYRVKLRFVGNSYAVSIPKELINFMNDQEDQIQKIVNLCLEDLGKISLNFKLH